MELVRPWANTDRVVVADSFFASVGAAVRLSDQYGLRFIGVVKTATKGYPMNLLGNVVLPQGKGDHYGVMAKDEESGKSILAWVWCDRDRRYFVSSCSSLSPGNMIHRQRW